MDKERILIIKLGAFGDFILASGLMSAIRSHHANAQITLLTTRPFVDLGRACPFVDEVWVDTRPKIWNVGAWWGLRRRLRAAGFRRVYDLQTSDRTAFYYNLFWPGPKPEWSGIAKGCSHPHTNPARDSLHALASRTEQLREAGIEAIPGPDISWLAADVSRFGLAGDYVLLVPGAAPHRPEKRWPVACFADLGRRLKDRGVRPVLIGTGADRRALDGIAAALPDVLDLGGKTDFAELATLARGAKTVIGNDTGPMHLAAAAGAPTLVLFSGASDPALSAPQGEKVAVLRRDPLSALTVDEVWTQIAEML